MLCSTYSKCSCCMVLVGVSLALTSQQSASHTFTEGLVRILDQTLSAMMAHLLRQVVMLYSMHLVHSRWILHHAPHRSFGCNSSSSCFWQKICVGNRFVPDGAQQEISAEPSKAGSGIWGSHRPAVGARHCGGSEGRQLCATSYTRQSQPRLDDAMMQQRSPSRSVTG